MIGLQHYDFVSYMLDRSECFSLASLRLHSCILFHLLVAHIWTDACMHECMHDGICINESIKSAAIKTPSSCTINANYREDCALRQKKKKESAKTITQSARIGPKRATCMSIICGTCPLCIRMPMDWKEWNETHYNDIWIRSFFRFLFLFLYL